MESYGTHPNPPILWWFDSKLVLNAAGTYIQQAQSGYKCNWKILEVWRLKHNQVDQQNHIDHFGFGWHPDFPGPIFVAYSH